MEVRLIAENVDITQYIEYLQFTHSMQSEELVLLSWWT